MSRIILDPGHGGTAPGAVNLRVDLKEKDVVLTIGLCLGRYLQAKKQNIELTRTKDIAVSLKDRCTFANDWPADYFISLHCNARQMRGKYGIELETYHYHTSRKGERLAEVVQRSLLKLVGREITVWDRGVKEGKYYVLRNTNMPAILVEMGFISDYEEAVWLEDLPHQAVLTKAVGNGILSYLGV